MVVETENVLSLTGCFLIWRAEISLNTRCSKCLKSDRTIFLINSSQSLHREMENCPRNLTEMIPYQVLLRLNEEYVSQFSIGNRK